MPKSLPTWNLKLIYSSPNDPQIEKDTVAIERACETFAKKYSGPEKKYLENTDKLLVALNDYEKLAHSSISKAYLYFSFLKDTDVSNDTASAKLSLIENRLAKARNKTIFFSISLGKIPKLKQKQFLSSSKLKKYKVFLERIFGDAEHTLSVEEEKIINLKNLPAYLMWLAGNERVLNMKTVHWKGKDYPIAAATKTLPEKRSERVKLSELINKTLKEVADFSEAEINAVYTDKKIDDELRGYTKAYDETIRSYRNDPKVVEQLVKTVTASFPRVHRFFKIKANLLKQKNLIYLERMLKVGNIKTKYPFLKSVQIIDKAFKKIDPKYSKIFNDFVRNGQVDVAPKIGKKGGAYCWGSQITPTFILLNHTDDLKSLLTIAHEFGHAFHYELSRVQGPLYYDYSFSLAETASTLFESIVMNSIIETLPKDQKIVVLHDKINDNISTIFRQIACFNFEKELHEKIRSKGFIPHQEIADAHNKHMSAYLGPAFKLTHDDGYMFVQWSHIRRFFYVYSYAYGLLVSKALLRRYKADKSFWKSIEKFLSAGGKDSPENILREIGIDVRSPEFFKEGIQELLDDITELEKLTRV